MHTKQDTNYYIVLRAFFLKTASLSTEEGKQWVLDQAAAIINKRDSVTVYTDLEQAKLAASQFTASEVPAECRIEPYKSTGTLAKPILCLPLASPLHLPESYTSIFIMAGKQITSESHPVPTSALGKWQETDWSVLINDQEIKQLTDKTSLIAQP